MAYAGDHPYALPWQRARVAHFRAQEAYQMNHPCDRDRVQSKDAETRVTAAKKRAVDAEKDADTRVTDAKKRAVAAEKDADTRVTDAKKRATEACDK